MQKRWSFIDTFIKHIGECEVPRTYFEWAAISLLAAAMGDRVWIEKFEGSGKKLMPNLYIFLVGPSGLGKGVAIDFAMSIIKDMKKLLGTYRGQISAPGLVDHLDERKKHKVADPSRLFMVTPELSLSVGTGEQAARLVRLTTELYTGGDYDFDERTRTSGKHSFHVPHPNWLAGSTEQWLVSSITPDDIDSGFFARVVTVSAPYNFKRRVYKPQAHPRAAEMVDRMQRRIHTLATRVQGQMRLSSRADAFLHEWYETKDVPFDSALLPSWRREHDLALKLGMVLAKDENPFARVVMTKHVKRALTYIEKTEQIIPHLLTLCSMTPESDALRFVQRVIEQAGDQGVLETELTWQASQRGLVKVRIEQVLQTLTATKRVIEEVSESGALRYRWHVRRMRLNKHDGAAS